MERKILMRIIGISISQAAQNNYLLLLEEVNGNRRLPIVTGMFEAQSIAIAMERVKITRPISHDLFKSFADAFHITIKEVLIYNLIEGVFYSKIICSNLEDDIEHELESRTSDAIAIAVRCDAPIYVYEFILKAAGYIVDENNNIIAIQVESTEEPAKKHTPSTKEEKADSLKRLTMEELQKKLQQAINEEKYELAAQIHQEIEKRKKAK